MEELAEEALPPPGFCTPEACTTNCPPSYPNQRYAFVTRP